MHIYIYIYIYTYMHMSYIYVYVYVYVRICGFGYRGPHPRALLEVDLVGHHHSWQHLLGTSLPHWGVGRQGSGFT